MDEARTARQAQEEILSAIRKEPGRRGRRAPDLDQRGTADHAAAARGKRALRRQAPECRAMRIVPAST
jgi:hypothetical protein